MAAVIEADFKHVVSRVIRRSAGYDTKTGRAVHSTLTDCNVETRIQGNFTLVHIMFGRRIIGCGISKRRSDEEFDPIIGYNIALVRAVEEAVNTLSSDMKSYKPDVGNGRSRRLEEILDHNEPF